MTTDLSPLSIAQLRRRAIELAEVSDSPRLDVELLLCHVLDVNRTYLFTWPERTLDASQAQQFEQLFERRQQGEPVAYILGQREFWSLSLAVAPSTLIPRPDTETLVEWALQLVADEALEGEGRRGLDLGTGTGAIALALASELPHWRWLGLDQSSEAVSLAEVNGESLALANVQFLHSDWFAQVAGRFDLIVSNPPYIDASDPHLEQGDVRFEPHSALVAGKQGLADLTQIIQQAPDFLNPGAWLLLEHGWQQHEAVAELLAARGFERVQSRQDLGGQWRVSGACWQPQKNA